VQLCTREVLPYRCSDRVAAGVAAKDVDHVGDVV
jgi:hypothetical protein